MRVLGLLTRMMTVLTSPRQRISWRPTLHRCARALMAQMRDAVHTQHFPLFGTGDVCTCALGNRLHMAHLKHATHVTH